MPGVSTMPRPASENVAHDFKISNWQPFEKNTLRGFLTITTPSGLLIHGCSLHQKGESRWIGLPGKKFVKADGTSSYMPMVEIPARESRDRFSAAALRAVDRAGLEYGK